MTKNAVRFLAKNELGHFSTARFWPGPSLHWRSLHWHLMGFLCYSSLGHVDPINNMALDRTPDSFALSNRNLWDFIGCSSSKRNFSAPILWCYCSTWDFELMLTYFGRVKADNFFSDPYLKKDGIILLIPFSMFRNVRKYNSKTNVNNLLCIHIYCFNCFLPFCLIM